MFLTRQDGTQSILSTLSGRKICFWPRKYWNQQKKNKLRGIKYKITGRKWCRISYQNYCPYYTISNVYNENIITVHGSQLYMLQIIQERKCWSTFDLRICWWTAWGSIWMACQANQYAMRLVQGQTLFLSGNFYCRSLISLEKPLDWFKWCEKRPPYKDKYLCKRNQHTSVPLANVI